MADMNIAIRRVVGVFLTLLLLTGLSVAQVVIPVAKPDIRSVNQSEITLTEIQESINVVKNSANLEEALKQRILNAYYAAEANLNESLELEQQTQVMQTQLKKSA